MYIYIYISVCLNTYAYTYAYTHREKTTERDPDLKAFGVFCFGMIVISAQTLNLKASNSSPQKRFPVRQREKKRTEGRMP